MPYAAPCPACRSCPFAWKPTAAKSSSITSVISSRLPTKEADFMERIRSYLAALQQTVDRLPADSIQQAITMLHEARLARRKVFLMGNGGSASTASHFVCDLAKNTRVMGVPDFRVIGLADNMAILTAYGNDE